MRFITKINGLFDRIPYALVAVFARIVAAHPFFASGQSKIDGPAFGGVFHGLDLTFKFPISLRDAAFTLFEEEHKLPLIPPDLAATLATIAENLLPVLLVLGLATRLSALGLLVMTLVIQFFVYPDAWWTAHAYWAALLIVLIARGPGALSIDHLLARVFGRGG